MYGITKFRIAEVIRSKTRLKLLVTIDMSIGILLKIMYISTEIEAPKKA